MPRIMKLQSRGMVGRRPGQDALRPEFFAFLYFSRPSTWIAIFARYLQFLILSDIMSYFKNQSTDLFVPSIFTFAFLSIKNGHIFSSRPRDF